MATDRMKYLNFEECARVLGLTARALAEMREAGVGPESQIIGGQEFFTRDDVKLFITQQNERALRSLERPTINADPRSANRYERRPVVRFGGAIIRPGRD